MISSSSVRKFFLPCIVASISVVLVETFSLNEFMELVEYQKDKDARRHEEYIFQGFPGREYPSYGTDRHGRKFKTCNVRNESAGVVEQEIHRCYLQPNQYEVGCFYTYTYETKQSTQGCYDVRAEDKTCTEKCNLKANKYTTPPGVPQTEMTTAFCCCTKDDCNQADEMDLQVARDMYQQEKKESHHHHHRRDLRPTSNHGKKFKKFSDLFHRTF